MELREYWRVITKRWWLVLLIPIVAAVTAGYYAVKLKTPIYQATASVLLMTSSPNKLPDTGTLQGVITGQSFDDALVARNPGLGVSSTQISQSLSVGLTGEILYFYADATSQALAASEADAVAQTFVDGLSGVIGVPSAVWNNHAVRSGVPPISPHKKREVLLALAMGLLVSLGLAFMLEYLDMRVKTEADMVRFLEIPVLGSVQDYHTKLKKIAK